MSIPESKKIAFTAKQGQYLAFIHHYTKLNGVAPAHTDMQKYFKVTPPTVNQMVKTLEQKGLISKGAGVTRSIKILLPEHSLPELM